jgi:hypothetical protein
MSFVGSKFQKIAQYTIERRFNIFGVILSRIEMKKLAEE